MLSCQLIMASPLRWQPCLNGATTLKGAFHFPIAFDTKVDSGTTFGTPLWKLGGCTAAKKINPPQTTDDDADDDGHHHHHDDNDDDNHDDDTVNETDNVDGQPRRRRTTNDDDDDHDILENICSDSGVVHIIEKPKR